LLLLFLFYIQTYSMSTSVFASAFEFASGWEATIVTRLGWSELTSP
jgi:hypothetical protein